MKYGGKRFREAVAAEVERQRLLKPITFRNLAINFDDRSFAIDGAKYTIETSSVVIPLVDTEHLLMPQCDRCLSQGMARRIERQLNEMLP